MGLGRAAWAAIGAALWGLVGCKYLRPPEEMHGGIELALRRGSSWATMTVRPPYIVGRTASLQLRRGLFTGMSAGGKLVHIQVDPLGALGRGPGRVDVDFVDEGPDEFVIQGVWNSDRVHFRITSDTFEGAIQGAWGHCQYTLDKTLGDGSRSGSSICSGLPEETRLEIPRTVLAYLTRAELAVVMLELFSGPPTTMSESDVRRPGFVGPKRPGSAPAPPEEE
jgi:hypothetical protein